MTSTIARALTVLAAPALALAAAPAQAVTVSHAPAAESTLVFGGDNADSWNHGRRGRGDRGRHRGWERGRGHDRDWDDDRRHYDEPLYRDTRVWRGDDGRNYCRRRDGTTGLIIGGAAGALIGRELAGRRGDRTLGTILGAAGGAIIGRELDGGRCR